MLKALASAGLTEKDVTYTNLSVPDAAAAFIAGKVDAAVIWQPWVSQIQREGKGKVIYSSADIPGLIPDIALCRTSVVEKRPKDIQKLVDVWFDVIAFIKAHQDEAVAIMAKVVEQPPDAYKAFMPGTKFFDLPMNLKSFEKRPQRRQLARRQRQIDLRVPGQRRADQEGARLRGRARAEVRQAVKK
jgi:NitT/TauT family transport system substrate-binding protein